MQQGQMDTRWLAWTWWAKRLISMLNDARNRGVWTLSCNAFQPQDIPKETGITGYSKRREPKIEHFPTS